MQGNSFSASYGNVGDMNRCVLKDDLISSYTLFSITESTTIYLVADLVSNPRSVSHHMQIHIDLLLIDILQKE